MGSEQGRTLKNWQRYTFAGVFAALLAALVWRAFRSVELSDEAYYIASVYDIFRGKAPLMTTWCAHTFACLQVPLLWLLHAVSPQWDGAFLYFRLAALLMKTLVLCFVAWHWAKGKTVWMCLPALFFVIFSIYTLSYNETTAYLLMIPAVLLGEQKPGVAGKKRRLYDFAAGVVMCLACISYPTMVTVALLLLVWIGWQRRKALGPDQFLWYCLGGGLTAIVFVCWIFSHGSVQMFLRAIRYLTKEFPHEVYFGDTWFIFALKTICKPFVIFCLKWTVLLPLGYMAAALWLVRRKAVRDLWPHAVLLAAYLLLCIPLEIIEYHSGYSIFRMVLGILVFLYCTGQRQIFLHRQLLFWLACAYTILYDYTSNNRDVFCGITVAGPMFVLWGGVMLGEALWKDHKRMTLGLLVVLCLLGLTCDYNYVYRDEPVPQLTQRVETGVYKGLYTTAGRKEYVEGLQQLLQERVGPADTLFTLTREPEAYLMADAEVCAPDTLGLHFPVDTNGMYQKYFTAFKKLPTVILVTDRWKDYIVEPEKEIEDLLAEYYVRDCQEVISGITVTLWRISPDGEARFNASI